MKIEFLFPEFTTIFGEPANVRYLSRCLPDAEVVKTRAIETPAFTRNDGSDQDVRIIYTGAMPEEYYEAAVRSLRGHLPALNAYIEQGGVFLATGNAIDLFGQEIEWDGRKIEGLGLFEFTTKVDRNHRRNCWFLGEFDGIRIIANRSTYSSEFGGASEAFIRKLGGFGMNDQADFDGVRRKNFYATSLLGPFLIMNPLFTERVLKLPGIEGKLWQREVILQAYQNRLVEFVKPNARFEMGGEG